MCKIITISGCSTVGKDTLLEEVLKINKINSNFNFKAIISDTTRPMRENEIQDREYHFVSRDEFIEKQLDNKYIENREYKVANDEIWKYGISKDEIDIDSNYNYLVIVDYKGVQAIKQFCKDNNIEILSYYFYVDDKIRLERALKRDNDCKEICRRFLKDIEEIDIPFREAKANGEDIHFWRNKNKYDLRMNVGQIIIDLMEGAF